jgi:hypothetical protein
MGGNYFSSRVSPELLEQIAKRLRRRRLRVLIEDEDLRLGENGG